MRKLLKRLALYAFHILVVRPLLYWGVGIRYRRRRLVPEGPCLVVANHNSHLDAAVLMTMFPLRRLAHVHPVAAADYFGKSWFMRTMAMALMNGIPIQRKAAAGADPLSPVVKRLEAGESLIFFPEGSRGEAGVVAKFRPGVGQLVRSLPGLLVVPVFISGPERIWPRGNVVPVPLSIDANLGRPRSYSVELSVREIADRVREDVLALAPPPPPVPGPPPEPPMRVSITSVDGEFRRRVVHALTERLGRVGRAMGVSDPMLEADGAGVREVTGPVPAGRGQPWVELLAVLFRTRGRFGHRGFAEMVERAQINEALSHGRDTRFIVVDGSALVELMAAPDADLYRAQFGEEELSRVFRYIDGEKKIRLREWWSFFRRAREVWLVNTFDLAQPPVPDVLVHLSRPIPGVMQGLLARGRELQPYQNEAFLERLQGAYRRVGTLLRRRRGVTWLDIDASGLETDGAADVVEQMCRSLVERPDAAAPGT